MRRRDWRPFAGAVLIGVAAGVLGLYGRDALLIGLFAGVVLAVVVIVGAREPSGWPDARREETSGTRREVSALTWAFIGLDGRVTEAAVRRLRVDASRRLAQNGIVVPGGLGARTQRDTPADVKAAARQALGDRAWAILTAPGGYMPSLADVSHCIDVVERLAPAALAPPARQRTDPTSLTAPADVTSPTSTADSAGPTDTTTATTPTTPSTPSTPTAPTDQGDA